MAEPDHTEVLKHLKTIIKVASDSYDIDMVHRLLGEMKRIVDKALLARRKTRTK